MKYELTAESKVHMGVTLRRVRALKDVRNGVRVGDLGGWVESEKNLTQDGAAWVSGNAIVSGNARVSGNAIVSGNAGVSGNARVYTPLPTAGRSDDYLFCVVPQKDGPVHVTAGCRDFTFAEARAHWSATRGGTPLGDETTAILDHLERMARLKGWPIEAETVAT